MNAEMKKTLATTDPELLQTMQAMEALANGEKDADQKLREAQAALGRSIGHTFAGFAANLDTLLPYPDVFSPNHETFRIKF